jgi:hypothetical protein
MTAFSYQMEGTLNTMLLNRISTLPFHGICHKGNNSHTALSHNLAGADEGCSAACATSTGELAAT